MQNKERILKSLSRILLIFAVLFLVQLLAAFILNIMWHGPEWGFSTYFLASNILLYQINLIQYGFSAILISAIFDLLVIIILFLIVNMLHLKRDALWIVLTFVIVKTTIFIAMT